MNERFKKLLWEYIPTSKNGVRFEVELKKLNISRQELSELWGVPINTLARKFNKNSKHYKKKQKKVIEEWALYGIQCAINDIKNRAEAVKNKKMAEAKELVNYTAGNIGNKEIVVAERSKDILDAINKYGRDITQISKEVNLSRTTVIKYIKKDKELSEALETSNDEAVLISQEVLKKIVEGGDTVSNKDKISAINTILKNNKSVFLGKEDSAPKQPAPNTFPNSSILIGNIINNKNNDKKPAKELVSDEDGEEFVILSGEEDINKKGTNGKLTEKN